MKTDFRVNGLAFKNVVRNVREDGKTQLISWYRRGELCHFSSYMEGNLDKCEKLMEWVTQNNLAFDGGLLNNILDYIACGLCAPGFAIKFLSERNYTPCDQIWDEWEANWDYNDQDNIVTRIVDWQNPDNTVLEVCSFWGGDLFSSTIIVADDGREVDASYYRNLPPEDGKVKPMPQITHSEFEW